MLSKYIQYFLDENNLEIGEEFMLTNENDNHKTYKTIYRNSDKTVINDSTLSNQIKWTVNDNYAPDAQTSWKARHRREVWMKNNCKTLFI